VFTDFLFRDPQVAACVVARRGAHVAGGRRAAADVVEA
jgi:hypothetical protein